MSFIEVGRGQHLAEAEPSNRCQHLGDGEILSGLDARGLTVLCMFSVLLFWCTSLVLLVYIIIFRMLYMMTCQWFQSNPCSYLFILQDINKAVLADQKELCKYARDTEKYCKDKEADEEGEADDARQTRVKEDLKQCDFPGCKYTTTKIYNLRRHMCRHTHKYISCDISGCKSKFTCESTKALHIGRAHLGQNMLMCELCSKSYQSPSGLRVHKAVAHAPEGKYKCQQCTATFFYSPALEAHMAKHTNVHPYYCSNCGRGFTYKQSVTRHEQEGICNKKARPLTYTCTKCQKRCSSKVRLAEHIKGKHGEKKHIMCVCGKTFSWKQSYNRHRNGCPVYTESKSKNGDK